MGLKSGSRDAGLDESEDAEEEETEGELAGADDDTHTDGDPERREQPSTGTETAESAESRDETGTSTQRPSMSSIPYKLRRDKVNEGREQVPYFLREEIIDAEDELQDTLEEVLGEDVYKSDYREASMVVAQRNPELVAEVLREWGYDLEAT